MPKVTVVIPVYNVEKYLRACLDSVVTQTLQDVEILCIDDGSTDHSGQILDDYAARDGRFSVIHQANAGVSAARNLGIDRATGKFLLFLDSDDWLEPTALEQACDCMEKDGDQADFAYFLFCFVDFPKRKRPIKVPAKTALTSDQERLQMAFDTQCVIWNRLYRRSFLVESAVRFPEGLRFEDNHFAILTALTAKRVLAIPQRLYNYRCAGLTSTPSQRCRQMDKIEVWALLLEEIRRRGFSAEIERDLTQRKFATYSHVYRRVPTAEQRPECRRRIENALSQNEWQRFYAGELKLSFKHRCFFWWFHAGWWEVLKHLFG